jgi:hypothetical protein
MVMKMQPWQQQIYDKLTSGGVKPSELMIMSAGRQTGKSYFTQQAIDRLMRDLNSQPVSDLVLSEGTVYGSRYHCVEPVGGNWMEMQEWCFTQFGDSGKHIWGEFTSPESVQRWYMNNRKFWFRDQADQLMFVMRWR